MTMETNSAASGTSAPLLSGLRSALEDLLASEKHLWLLRLQEVRAWQEIVPPDEASRLASSARLVEQVMEKRNGLLYACLAEIRAARVERENIEADRAARQEDVLKARRRFEAAERKVEDALRNDHRIVALAERETSLTKLLEANRGHERELDLLVQERLRDFTSDRVFAYLLKKGFGTDDYASGFPVRKLDGVLAKWAEFDREFANYEKIRLYPEVHAKMLAEAEAQLPTIEPRRRKLREQIRASLDVHRERLADALNAAAKIEDRIASLEAKAPEALTRIRQGVRGEDRETRMMTDAVVSMLAAARDAAAGARPAEIAEVAQRSEGLMRARLSVARDADGLRSRALALLDEADREVSGAMPDRTPVRPISARPVAQSPSAP